MAMVQLLRTAPEVKHLRRVSVIWCFAAACMMNIDMLEEQGAAVLMAAVAAREVLKPTRSWQKGINRVVIWSFDNMYSEVQCYQCVLRVLIVCAVLTGAVVCQVFPIPQGRHGLHTSLAFI